MPRSVFSSNYCEIRCKLNDDLKTSHGFIHKNLNDFLNDQII